MSDMVVLEAVDKEYRRGRETVHALHDVALSIGSGELVAIVGPSGSGKSTLLQMIGCVDKPTRGRIRVGAREINGMSESDRASFRGKTVGFVFQQFFLLPTLTALENVELPGLFAGLKTREARARSLLQRVGLKERLGHFPQELSGGEMQRVAIARALINDPSLILADEPTGNLDSDSADQIMHLLAELNREGRTIVLVTHNQELAERAHRRVRLRDGKLVTGE